MNVFLKLTMTAVFLVSIAGATEPVPAATPAAGLTVESLVALVPAEAKLKSGGKWQAVNTALATEAMRSKGIGQQIEFKIKVAVLEPHPYNGHAVCIHSKPTPVTINGTSIPYIVYVYVDADGLAGLGNVHIGETVTITGVLNKADIEVRGTTASLVCEQLRAQLKPPTAKQ
jgi:hypothetical protein